MIGTYRFIQNGEVVAEQSNLITTAGKKAIIDYIAGYTKRLAGSMAVGIGSTAANVADRKLAFEVARYNIGLATADYANNAVVFRATIPADMAMTVYEAGLYTLEEQATSFGAELITGFSTDEAWSAGTFVATNSRLDTALQVTAAASTQVNSSLAGLGLDLSGYSDGDQFSIAVRNNNAFATTITVRFRTDLLGNHYTWGFTAPASGTYAVFTTSKSAITVTGTPNWANITQIDVAVTAGAGGTASVDFDAIRVDDIDVVNEENVLFSRAVMGTPFVKTGDVPMDVEYAVTL